MCTEHAKQQSKQALDFFPIEETPAAYRTNYSEFYRDIRAISHSLDLIEQISLFPYDDFSFKGRVRREGIFAALPGIVALLH